MKASNWAILGALAGFAGVAINKQLRLARNRLAEALPDAERRSSIDDVPADAPGDAPHDVPTIQAAAEGRVSDLDDRVAPGAPF
jgi:hypothetical protein